MLLVRRVEGHPRSGSGRPYCRGRRRTDGGHRRGCHSVPSWLTRASTALPIAQHTSTVASAERDKPSRLLSQMTRPLNFALSARRTNGPVTLIERPASSKLSIVTTRGGGGLACHPIGASSRCDVPPDLCAPLRESLCTLMDPSDGRALQGGPIYDGKTA